MYVSFSATTDVGDGVF